MASRWLERMSWAEAEKALQENGVLVLPLGAQLKEHGLHLPLNNDWLMAEGLTRRVAERVDVIVLPTLGLSYYPAFVEYPGSVSLEFDTSRRLIVEMCACLGRFGGRKIYCLNTGISTLRVLEQASRDLHERQIRFEYLDLDAGSAEVEKAIQQQEGGTHADELETSMMLYLTPDQVRLPLARKDYTPGSGPLTRDPHNAKGVYSPTGAWGDPTLATLEKGRRIVEALVDHIVRSIHSLKEVV